MRSEFEVRARVPMRGGCGRPCLRCRRPFDSEGPTERVCGLCKLSEDWMWAVAACKGHIEW